MTTPEDAIRGLRAADQRNQGRAETPEAAETGVVTAERLEAIEAVARSVRHWNPSIIPGPLQTTRYAAAAIKMGLPALPNEEVQLRAHQRAARIDAFLKRWSDTPGIGHAWFMLGEQAITQPIAHRHAHMQQLRHLVNLANSQPRIVIQVISESVPTPGRLGQFSVYELEGRDGRSGPRVCYLETPVGGWYSTRPGDIARLYGGFGDMVEAALPPADSAEYIEEVLDCWENSEEPSTSSPATATPGTA